MPIYLCDLQCCDIVNKNCDYLPVISFLLNKINMPCKLCEKSIHQQKIGGANCCHSSIPLVFSENLPLGMQSVSLGLPTEVPNSPFLPQLNMMLTAYLFRGKLLGLAM